MLMDAMVVTICGYQSYVMTDATSNAISTPAAINPLPPDLVCLYGNFSL